MNFQKHLNNLKLDKKYLIFSLLLLILIIIIPLLQSLLFSHSHLNKNRIEVNEIIDAPFLKVGNKENVIMFFGYVGCTEVCIPLLHQLKTMYEKNNFINLHPSTEIFFINLLPDVEAITVKQFAEVFNTNFIGINLSQHELNNLERKFRLFFSANLFNKEKINHTDYIYLIKRQSDGQLLLKNIYYTYPFKPENLRTDLLKWEK